ncbi:MAG: glycoside hydrolase [Acidobacteria bacterium]|nr:glycoside hydrolase [Acidobacteriota bacterium]
MVLRARLCVPAFFLLVGVPSAVLPQSGPGGLKSGFENPPASARPRVWWHWMNGNITKEGIKLDLDWMHRVGIAGFQNFDAALATPQVVDKRLPYMTPEWKDAFKYATTLADQYGMEIAIAASPGWSETGGPWVPPSHGMKKYVWSETAVEGGKHFHGQLNHPPENTGAFQNAGVRVRPGNEQTATAPPQFYGEAAVVAFRRPWTSLELLQPTVTSSSGTPDFASLADGNIVKTTELPIASGDQPAWIQWEYPKALTIRSLTIATSPGGAATWRSGVGVPDKTLEASDDGNSFREIAKLIEGRAPQTTISIPETTAKFFRVTFKATPPPPPPAWAQGIEMPGASPRATPTAFKIAELALHQEPHVNHFEEKAAFALTPDLYGYATLPATAGQSIERSDVIDLTSKMQADGMLDWTPPPGQWVVLRFGYSLLGITNHPATQEATGLEVDKLDRRYVRDYFEKYLDSYKETVGPELIGKRGIQYVINDSWEAGSLNWTDNMIAQFTKLRGYSPVPWMPVLAGYIVESSEASDRFLWDLRKTIADLITVEHYEQIESILHEWHMAHYGESHEVSRAIPADGMEVKKMNEIPMSAMWTQVPGGPYHEQYGYNADDRESASVAHIYGQNFVAAESLTAAAGPWAWSPATLKPTADQEFLNGINRFVIHESAHQPLVGKAPGLTLGPFGQWFNRNETWADEAGVWMDYLARTSFMLQQGRFRADVLYFYGEDSNLTAIFANKAPDVPTGYGFDYVNADALIHEFKVKDGQITTASGMSYRLLALDDHAKHMSLPVLKAIQTLVEQGATICGSKPVDDPSLSDDQKEFQKIATELFGDGIGMRNVGKGKVYAAQRAANALSAMQLTPDLNFSKTDETTRLEFVHRQVSGADIYFVDNRSDKSVTVQATFRVSGREPEFWRAETGKSTPAPFTIAKGTTTVPLNLEPWGTVFVVFQRPTSQASRKMPDESPSTLLAVDGQWSVSFQPDRGAPASIRLDKLISWPESEDKGVKYFSGTATYTKSFDVKPEWLGKGKHLRLDLGDVRNLAQIDVNGKPLGVVWHTPYKVDISDTVKPGSNQLVVKVTNSWVNRLIGDQQPDAKTKYTFTAVKPYKANSPLQPSGLIGPVTISSGGRE